MGSTIRRRIEGLLNGLNVPSPLDVDALAQQIAARRGRPIRLAAKETHLGPCGLWAALPKVDVVLYESATSRLHRDHIVLHELSHVLCSHSPSEVLPEHVIRLLMPDLNPSVVAAVMGRTTYSEPEEQEAELAAAMIVERAGGIFTAGAGARPKPASDSADEPLDGGALARLSLVFGSSGGPHV